MGAKSIIAVVSAAGLLGIAAAVAQQRGAQTGQQSQAQAQAPAQPPGMVTGQVVSATTNEPLRKVSLTLQPAGRGGGGAGAGQRAAATSDNGGAFRFASVQPGTYTLTGDRTGFVRGTYGQDQQGGEARTIEVTSGQTSGGIQLKLIPHSVVTGRVFDEDGDPVEGAQVQILRYTYARGQRQLSTAANGSTNDLGEYRVSGLAPGRYYASAVGRGGRGGGNRGGRGARGQGGPGGLFGGPADDPGVQEGYVTTYYPRTAAAAGATPLDLVPGSELRGIDIGLLKERFYNVTGVIEGVTVSNIADTLGPLAQQLESLQQQLGRGGGRGKAKQFGKALDGVPNVSVNLQARDQAGGRPNQVGGARVQANGSFEFQGVPPGAYYLLAQTRNIGAQQQMTARMAVDVTSGNLENLRLRLLPPVNVTGTIAPEHEDSNLKFDQVRINFAASTPGLGGGFGGGRGGGGRIDIDAKGAFQTQLDPDVYNVELSGLPAGYYLKAVKMSSREVPDAVLDLSYAAGPLDIVLGADAGSITGFVQKGNDPAPNMRVTAVPASGSPRRDLYKAANSGDDGSFTLSGLPPGNYKVYAWEQVDGNAWMDVEFRRPFESLAASAEVSGTQSPSLNLKLIGLDQLTAAGVR